MCLVSGDVRVPPWAEGGLPYSRSPLRQPMTGVAGDLQEGVVVADEPWVGLADAVRGVRQELAAAMAAGEGEKLRFEVGPVELEFAVDIRKEAGAEAGARVFVASFSSRGSVAAGSTHRMKLTLNPQDEQGNPAKVNTTLPSIPKE